MKKNWSEVAKIYVEGKRYNEKVTNAEETALHVAISNYHSDQADDILDRSIKEMINSIPDRDVVETLLLPNDRGNTVLHRAAAVGWQELCELIASKGDKKLMEARNHKKETPLFVTVLYGNLKAFACLSKIHREKVLIKPDDRPEKDKDDDHNQLAICRKDGGTTILHTAIADEHFELAFKIMCDYPNLMNLVNEAGQSPLYALAMKPNVFKSSTNYGLYDSVIYYCTFVEELKKDKGVDGKKDDSNSRGRRIHQFFPENYQTCVSILELLWSPIINSFTAGFKKGCSKPRDEENQDTRPQDEGQGNTRYYPANYTTCVLLCKFGMKVILTLVGVGFSRIKRIQEKKRQHTHALQIMNSLIENQSQYKYGNDGHQPVKETKPQLPGILLDIPDSPPEDEQKDGNKQTNVKTETPLLAAARKGIPEMVEKILKEFPIACEDLDSTGKNVVLMAAENRNTSVFNHLVKQKLPEYVFHQVDKDENTVLHLAAKLGEAQPWRIPGAALQMQWEIKWYEHVKRKIPRLSYARSNREGETAHKVFMRSHESLVEKGNTWLIKTSESCSLVAALIATVAFATSATIPGGFKQDSGQPIMEKLTAFDIFSISSLIALCLSVTALVFFLAIITSRCQARDFKAKLPNKLLMGLTALFASIAAMLVSFCAGHSFILRHDVRIAAVPIYAIACVPVTLFALAQLPLYFDLLRANCVEVPLRSYKEYDH